MTVELGGITLNLLTQVFVEEQARIVHHEVPGMSGNLAQTLGRPSVRVVLQGIFEPANGGFFLLSPGHLEEVNEIVAWRERTARELEHPHFDPVAIQKFVHTITMDNKAQATKHHRAEQQK